MEMQLISVACVYSKTISKKLKAKKYNQINPTVFRFLRKIYARRKIWAHSISTHYFDEIWNYYSDDLFLRKYRMNRSTFQFICNEVSPFLTKQDTRMRKCIPIHKKVAVALHLLKSSCDHSTVADLYGIGESTAKQILLDFIYCVATQLKSKFIKFPNNEEMTETVRSFESIWGFPGCIGAVDGSHIPIMKPKNHHTDYFNYKKYFSLNLMAMADWQYMFTYINVGQTGRNSDATVFARSTLRQRIAEEGFFRADKNYHIISDGAFPIEVWNMKPYTDTGNLDRNSRNFNYRLSRARMVIECAFGRLKGRWRVLLKKLDHSPANSTFIIATCCILHNICEKQNNYFHDQWNDGDDLFEVTDLEQPEQIIIDRGRNNRAVQKRNLISELLSIE